MNLYKKYDICLIKTLWNESKRSALLSYVELTIFECSYAPDTVLSTFHVSFNLILIKYVLLKCDLSDEDPEA